MLESQPDHQRPVKILDKKIRTEPARLFIVSIAIIFASEALLMMLIFLLDLHGHFFIGLVDATLLSCFVVPTLYYMFFKPMRETILSLDKSEEFQKKLEDVDRLKNDFISIASHELCTPVTVIMGYTEMLLEDSEPEQRREYLEVIQRKTATLKRIIDDLGIVNRLESGVTLDVMQAEHDLLKTVGHVWDVYRVRFPDVSIHLELPQGPLIVEYDEIRINQVLDNLLSNAVKYSEDVRDSIALSVVDQQTQVLVRIKDEGIGMTADELRQVYNKFYRAQAETSLVGGLGLGMAIVKNIIEAHNGTIDIISQRNVGTTVTIALPKSASLSQEVC